MSFMPRNLKCILTFCVCLSSTDSQLKLWNVGKPYCLRSFKGHINEKNFVGLASNGDYIACGKWNLELFSWWLSLKLPSMEIEYTPSHEVVCTFRRWRIDSMPQHFGFFLGFTGRSVALSLLYWAQALTTGNSIKLLNMFCTFSPF